MTEEQFKNLKTGDKVRILKPEIGSWSWSDMMLEHVGDVIEISPPIMFSGYVTFGDWLFPYHCLELVEEEIYDPTWFSPSGLTQIKDKDDFTTATEIINKAREEFTNRETFWHGQGITQRLEGLKQYELPKVKLNNKKNIMQNIIKFAKDSTLSSDEKLLRKVGLKDSDDGCWTHSARELVFDFKAKDLGYESYFNLQQKVNRESMVSPLEVASLLNDYKDQILETAKSYEKEQDKQK